jgi:hypothetical protein
MKTYRVIQIGGGTLEYFHEAVAEGYTHIFSARMRILGKMRGFMFHARER